MDKKLNVGLNICKVLHTAIFTNRIKVEFMTMQHNFATCVFKWAFLRITSGDEV